MSIIDVNDITYRKFSGYEDPRYPSGMWLGEGLVTGDGSGGDSTVQIDFSKAAGLRNSQYYSLEEIFAVKGNNVSAAGDMLVTNFDVGDELIGRRYHFLLLATEGGVSNLTLSPTAGTLRMFLGQQSTPNSAQSISFIIDNTNLIDFAVRIGGYVWSARSSSVPGGPQRPPTGLYSP